MEPRAYYNENDQFAAAWLRELIAAGLIAPGDVDERSIVDVRPDDLVGYTQCHFFAGIGGWSFALRLAGWDDARPVWTGSCPCQPFSAAGKQKAEADKRHLWPELHRLVRKRAPAILFGEQVASKLGRGWLAGVRADLEALGYAVGAADLCAAGAGAPHIRQRLWWVAHADGGISGDGDVQPGGQHGQQSQDGGVGGMADSDRGRQSQRAQRYGESVAWIEAPRGNDLGGRDDALRLGDTDIARSQGYGGGVGQRSGERPTGPTGSLGFWSDFGVVHCTDGKARRTEPGTFPLAHGIPARVGRLRGYGNAIVPQVAAAFIKAASEAMKDVAHAA